MNRVPEVTPGFWIIKLMAVTMGETAADYLAVNLGLGLPTTSIMMAGLLAIALFVQFKARRYVPSIYWLNVVMISIVGTLVTDNLTDNLGVPLMASTLFFTTALAATFAMWWRSEKSLSIHTIFTAKREGFYWLAILFTFALGTAVGDMVAEQFGLGYAATGVLFAMIIASVSAGYATLKLDGLWAFWICYIFTRPLGASFGDLLSQPADYGGMGFGTVPTSLGFLIVIAATVGMMTLAKPKASQQHA